MSTPTVSVIVPNYNHARFLRQRLDSILVQTYQDFELILLDDCSTDDSQTILREYASHPRVSHFVLNEANSGSTFKQWNKGVRLARGKYVWIAESDDYAAPRLLESLVSLLDADPTAVLAQCRSWRVSADGELFGFQDARLPDPCRHLFAKETCTDGIEECRNYLVRCCSIQNASSVVFRKDVYCQVGGADETFRQCGDWKTWASLALTGGAIWRVGEPLNFYRYHGASVSGRNQANRQNGVLAAETLRVVAWIFHHVQLEPDVTAKVRDELAELWVPAVLNRRTSLAVRKNMLKDARSIDKRALQRLTRGTYTALRLTTRRRWQALRGCRFGSVSSS